MKDEKKIRNPAWLDWAFVLVVFGAIVGNGAFFAAWCCVLNIFFLVFLFIRKGPLRVDSGAALMTGLFAGAVLSALVGQGNPYAAMETLVKYMLFPLAYLSFLQFDDRARAETALYHGTVFLAVTGLMAVGGLHVTTFMVTEGSGRLQSFLQYANTTALLLGAGILLALDRLLAAKSIKRGWRHLLALAVLVPALILTRSRIGFWFFVIILAFYVFLHLGRKARRFFIAGMGALVLGFMLLGSRLLRVSLWEGTLVERFITYADALAVLRFHPWGIGPGDWQFVQLTAQSAPYYVKYIHSVFFQMALDCGFVGLLCFLAAVGLALYRGLRRRDTGIYLLLLFLAEGALDIHFSFGLVIVYGMFFLSAHSAKPLREVNVPRRPGIVLLAVPLLVFFASECLVVYGGTQTGDRAISAFASARVLNPWNSTALVYMAAAQTDAHKALDYLTQGHEAEPRDAVFVSELSRGYALVGDYDKAIDYAWRYFWAYTYRAESQENFHRILDQARKDGAVTQQEYEEQTAAFEEAVRQANEAINPWYRHIDPQMQY